MDNYDLMLKFLDLQGSSTAAILHSRENVRSRLQKTEVQTEEVLKNGAMSVEGISKKVGYNGKIHFYKAFDDVFAMKPSEMRLLLK